MGTIWRNLGSATRTKTRIDSSTLRNFASSTESAWGVMAAGTYFGTTAWARAGAADRRPALQFFLQPGDAAEFFQGRAVVRLLQGFLIQGGDMLDGNFDAVDGAEDAAAEFFQAAGVILDLFGGGVEQRMET